ncbi:MAG TPA: Gfo/Idh/MocA family oxidoreductase, partial [Fimbriimonadaceae bacterium]|nr:Gfo/Idh/MocA family oxidoreductase [Fimbriimonadaceae bacterium]
GVIGCGLMGREFASASARWLHLLDLDFKPEIVAACDPNPQALGWFQQALPLELSTADYRELLNHDLDAVYCAVPHNLHEEIYVEIILSGKHLLAEKPFGIDLGACERIIESVRLHPEVLVRCSSEFPFFPGAQRIVKAIAEGALGRVIEVGAGFLHSSDLDPGKPINWKRRVETCGQYGVMGDLGMHVVHVPFRSGWTPKNVRSLLSNIVPERSGEPCDTWDNATLACEVEADGATFPMILETKRIAPGETNTWYLRVFGTELSLEFSTKRPKTLRSLSYSPGAKQIWGEEDLGYSGAYPAVTGGIFEFGFPDAILQMWAAFCDELVAREEGRPMKQPFICATPDEALLSHRLFSSALTSQERGSTEPL